MCNVPECANWQGLKGAIMGTFSRALTASLLWATVVASACDLLAATYNPSQIQTVYGINAISGIPVSNLGANQTIAIVDAYHYANALSDLNYFSSYMGLPTFGSGGPTFTQYSTPNADPTGGWETEAALDLQWAHAIAPRANLVLVETADDLTYDGMLSGVDFARNLPDVSVVSTSWGGLEYRSEILHDSYFTTPAGHRGVTFVASTGDNGAPGCYLCTLLGWPDRHHRPNTRECGLGVAGWFLGDSAEIVFAALFRFLRHHKRQ
jgi:subtilase family serine protease